MGWTVRYDMPDHTAGGNTCYVCRAGQRQDHKGQMEALLDPNIHIEFEGWMLICASCIVEAAHDLGLPTESLRQKLQDQIDRLSAKLDETQIRADAAEEAVRAMTRYNLVRSPDADSSPSPSVPDLAFDADLAGEDLGEGEGTPARRSLGRRR